ncbi:phosphoprotein [Harrison Dam virus]|uniref:Phosphoprotein n=1 Tax=Harrison Dam virus TaxID=1569259 RepID=A0A0A0V5M3_9RHAB|nr:phosphoprotein [Harrison Dam virus]AIW61119.1 phosphoprotein [Harrison Dam virus]
MLSSKTVENLTKYQEAVQNEPDPSDGDLGDSESMPQLELSGGVSRESSAQLVEFMQRSNLADGGACDVPYPWTADSIHNDAFVNPEGEECRDLIDESDCGENSWSGRRSRQIYEQGFEDGVREVGRQFRMLQEEGFPFEFDYVDGRIKVKKITCDQRILIRKLIEGGFFEHLSTDMAVKQKSVKPDQPVAPLHQILKEAKKPTQKSMQNQEEKFQQPLNTNSKSAAMEYRLSFCGDDTLTMEEFIEKANRGLHICKDGKNRFVDLDDFCPQKIRERKADLLTLEEWLMCLY